MDEADATMAVEYRASTEANLDISNGKSDYKQLLIDDSKLPFSGKQIFKANEICSHKPELYCCSLSFISLVKTNMFKLTL